MQLWPATISSPSHETYLHGGYNYRVFPQQNTSQLQKESAENSLLVLRGVAYAFFVSDDLPEPTSCPKISR